MSETFLKINQPSFLSTGSDQEPNSFPKFKELLDFIAQDERFENFSEIYQKNLSFSKESQRICQNILGGHEIEIKWFKECSQGIQTKKNQIASPTDSKNFNISKKTLLIWLVSIFEVLTETTFDSFVKKSFNIFF